jgi:hypothetical protein
MAAAVKLTAACAGKRAWRGAVERTANMNLVSKQNLTIQLTTKA